MKKAQAEVDFSFVHQGKICGVEVKSGSTGKMRLDMFDWWEGSRHYNKLLGQE